MGDGDARVLVVFAHPAFERSRVNRVLVDAAVATEGITVWDLYEAYPEFDIDVVAEQERLLAHDVIVFLHPFYWYSLPALLKQWQDLVLEHGWAYGHGGEALADKVVFHAITAGGGKDAYHRSGYNRFTIGELTRPWAQTAALCGMRYLPPFVAFGTHRMSADDIAGHGRAFARLLRTLRRRDLDLEAAEASEHLNDRLDAERDPSPGEAP
ncbi:MAG: NAD(P)H-dependent oxidoreductase [Myxococcota bacterium]